jgi:hypothetical protein
MICDGCHKELTIGEWPWCPHGFPEKSKGFEPYWDENISDHPVLISNPGDRNKHLRPHWEGDYLVHVQPKDRPASYFRELNDRRAARAEAERKARR